MKPFEPSSSLVNNAAFVADGGYQRPELWMSEGWALVQRANGRHSGTDGMTTRNSPWRAAAAAIPRLRCGI